MALEGLQRTWGGAAEQLRSSETPKAGGRARVFFSFFGSKVTVQEQMKWGLP